MTFFIIFSISTFTLFHLFFILTRNFFSKWLDSSLSMLKFRQMTLQRAFENESKVVGIKIGFFTHWYRMECHFPVWDPLLFAEAADHNEFIEATPENRPQYFYIYVDFKIAALIVIKYPNLSYTIGWPLKVLFFLLAFD